MSLFDEYEQASKQLRNVKAKILAKVAKAVSKNANEFSVVAIATYQEDEAVEGLDDCVTFKDFKKSDFVVTALETKLDDYSKMQVLLHDDRPCANHRLLPLFKLEGQQFAKVAEFIMNALGEPA